MGEMIRLKSKSDGFEFEAYHAQPDDARRGGLIVVQEIFGVTQGIKDIADSFAADGYEEIAPSMYDRSEPGLQVQVAGAGVLRLIGDAGASFPHVQGDIQACIDALKPPVFITGFCYGGTVAWLAAARCTGLAGASAFYGGGISGLVAETPQVPVILHFGKKDSHITSEHWDTITAAHPDVPLFLYEADHGFFSHDRSDYHPEPARLARLRTLQHFHKAASGKVEA